VCVCVCVCVCQGNARRGWQAVHQWGVARVEAGMKIHTCLVTLQHTATHCNTLQHTATHISCHTRTSHMMSHVTYDLDKFSLLQHTATHCNTLQHTATHISCHTRWLGQVLSAATAVSQYPVMSHMDESHYESCHIWVTTWVMSHMDESHYESCHIWVTTWVMLHMIRTSILCFNYSIWIYSHITYGSVISNQVT